MKVLTCISRSQAGERGWQSGIHFESLGRVNFSPLGAGDTLMAVRRCRASDDCVLIMQGRSPYRPVWWRGKHCRVAAAAHSVTSRHVSVSWSPQILNINHWFHVVQLLFRGLWEDVVWVDSAIKRDKEEMITCLSLTSISQCNLRWLRKGKIRLQ